MPGKFVGFLEDAHQLSAYGPRVPRIIENAHAGASLRTACVTVGRRGDGNTSWEMPREATAEVFYACGVSCYPDMGPAGRRADCFHGAIKAHRSAEVKYGLEAISQNEIIFCTETLHKSLWASSRLSAPSPEA